MGGRTKNLAKAPYLVLFIVLISMGVGTASALITITLAGDLHVTGDTTLDGSLSVGTDNPSDDDLIWFDDGSEFLMWDDSQTQFEFRDDIVTGDVIQAGNAGPNVAYSRIGIGTADSVHVSTSADFFVTGNIETNDNFYANRDIFVGTTDGGDDDIIWFDDGSEFLMWDDSQTQFEFRDDIVTADTIQAGNAGPNVSYNRIGAATTNHGLSGANDLLITDDVEIDQDLFVDGDIKCNGCIHSSDIANFGIQSNDIALGAVIRTITLTGEFEVNSNEGGIIAIQMISTTNSMCYLTSTDFDALTNGDLEHVECKIENNNGTWELEATAFEGDITTCKARCLTWGG